MFNEEKLKVLEAKTKARAEAPQSSQGPLEGMSEEELRTLHAQVEARLPPLTLNSINLEEELMLQFRTVKSLQSEIRNDIDIPPNQKAQVAAQVAGTLQHLIKMQDDLNKMETLKLMEAVLIDAIKTLPEDVKTAFFDDYEARAKRAGLC